MSSLRINLGHRLRVIYVISLVAVAASQYSQLDPV